MNLQLGPCCDRQMVCSSWNSHAGTTTPSPAWGDGWSRARCGSEPHHGPGAGPLDPRTCSVGVSRRSSPARAGSSIRAASVLAASLPTSAPTLSTLVSQIDRNRASCELS